ncbi:MAG: VOC family protein [Nitrososphaerales archaeon]
MTFFFYTGIIVRDLDRSIKFYTEVLGMMLVDRIKNPYTNGEFAELASREGELPLLELNWYANLKDQYKNGDELDHLGFLVEDAYKELERFKKIGVEIAQEPYESKHHVIFFVKDPDGIWIEILSKKHKDAIPKNVSA